MQNFLRIDNYGTLWLSWLKGVIMGIILMSLLSGCYIYEGTTYSDPNYVYTQENDLSYYHTHYVPTIDLYYWNNLPYWGYHNGWYYYYGYRHSYPWWYYYEYSPAYHYSIHTHVYCYLDKRNYVVRPRTNRRLNNKKHRTYNVQYVNQKGSVISNNSHAPTRWRNTKVNSIKTNRTNRTNTIIRNNTTNTIINNRSNEIHINKNKNNRSNNKVNIKRTNTNRSNKTNNRRPR